MLHASDISHVLSLFSLSSVIYNKYNQKSSHYLKIVLPIYNMVIKQAKQTSILEGLEFIKSWNLSKG